MNASIRAAIDQAAQGEIPYPVLAKRLRESGIRTYHVDVATHTAVYQGDGEPFTIKGEDVARASEKAPAFNQPGIVAALLATQRREIDYDGFLQRIWQSGVQEIQQVVGGPCNGRQDGGANGEQPGEARRTLPTARGRKGAAPAGASAPTEEDGRPSTATIVAPIPTNCKNRIGEEKPLGEGCQKSRKINELAPETQ